MKQLILPILLFFTACTQESPKLKNLSSPTKLVMELAPETINLEVVDDNLTGSVVNASSLDFGEIVAGSKVTKRINLWAKSNISNLDISGFRNSQTFIFKSSNCGLALNRNRSCVIDFEFTAPETSGPVSELLSVSMGGAPVNFQAQLLVIPPPTAEQVLANVTNNLTVSSLVALGDFSGSTKKARATIFNLNNISAEINITPASFATSGFSYVSYCPAQLKSKTSCQIDVIYSSSDELTTDTLKNEQLTINNLKNITVSVNHKATEQLESGEFVWLTNPLNLGTISSIKKQIVYVKNNTSNDISGLSFNQLPQGVSSLRSNCTSLLKRNFQCYVELQFNPAQMIEGSFSYEYQYSSSKAIASLPILATVVGGISERLCSSFSSSEALSLFGIDITNGTLTGIDPNCSLSCASPIQNVAVDGKSCVNSTLEAYNIMFPVNDQLPGQGSREVSALPGWLCKNLNTGLDVDNSNCVTPMETQLSPAGFVEVPVENAVDGVSRVPVTEGEAWLSLDQVTRDSRISAALVCLESYQKDGITCVPALPPQLQGWVEAITPYSNDSVTLSTVAYGNNTFVTMSSTPSYKAAVSSDGINWTAVNTPFSTDSTGFNDVKFLNNQFVAVGVGLGGVGKVWTSPDGINWTEQNAAANFQWKSVTYGNGLYVAVASNGAGQNVMTSPDAVNWTLVASPDRQWNSITYANGLFVAVGNSSTGSETAKAMTSPDGINWTLRTLAATTQYNSVVYGNGLFVVVGNGVNNAIMTSSDGITWLSNTDNSSTGLMSVIYANGLFVAVGSNIKTYSANGINWNPTVEIGTGGSSVTYGNGVFVKVNSLQTSTDGITWTNRTADVFPLARNYVAVTYANNLYVSVASNGTKDQIMSSPDGTTWTIRQAPVIASWQDVTYGDKFVAIPSLGSVPSIYSNDGITWSSGNTVGVHNLRSLAYGNNMYVAIGSSGAISSPDGITWTTRSIATSTNWQSVTYGNGLFVAVAATGTNRVSTSTTGTSWTSRTAAEANSWQSVTYGNGLFVAVANTGTNRVMTSPDGITWTAQAAAEANSWKSVTYDGNNFVAVAQSNTTGTGRVMTSPDGITWTIDTSATMLNALWNDICFGDKLVAVASGGSLTNRAAVYIAP